MHIGFRLMVNRFIMRRPHNLPTLCEAFKIHTQKPEKVNVALKDSNMGLLKQRKIRPFASQNSKH